MKEAVGRVGRWLFFGVALAIIPVLISFLWLPRNESVTMLLSHGDLAVIASALAGISMGELIGPDEPEKWIRNVLMSSCILLLVGSVVLLSLIASRGGRLTLGQEVAYSWFLFIVAVLIGVASMGATVRRI
jgi:ABC-type transport system involved in multi-copper enzyme maturation permease subunit